MNSGRTHEIVGYNGSNPIIAVCGTKYEVIEDKNYEKHCSGCCFCNKKYGGHCDAEFQMGCHGIVYQEAK